MAEPKFYVILPAAGLSRRMQTAKLLLPWPTELQPEWRVIDSVLAAWTSCSVKTKVVVRSHDDGLLKRCKAWPVDITQADAPEDMKASLQIGLRQILASSGLAAQDYLFVAPADLPTLSVVTINALIAAAKAEPSAALLLPFFAGKRGHPALLSGSLAMQIFDLRAHEGVDSVVRRSTFTRVDLPGSLAASDIDTPEEYQLAIKALQSQ